MVTLNRREPKKSFLRAGMYSYSRKPLPAFTKRNPQLNFPGTITFELKESHIYSDCRGSSNHCMMAIAISEHLNLPIDSDSVSVLPEDVFIYVDKERTNYSTTEEFAHAVVLFDLGHRNKIKVGQYILTRKK